MANINVKVNPVTTTSVSIGSTSNKVKQVAIGQVAAENIDLNDLRNVDTRESGMKAVNYMKLIPLLIESIKELKNEVESLKDSKS